jgi:hypothetical protein
MAKHKNGDIAKSFKIINLQQFKKKLKDEENRFKLEMMGQESEEKSVRFIKENDEEVKKQELELEGRHKEKLEKSKRGKKWNYYVRLAEISVELISKYSDLPKFFKWGVYPTKRGVVYWLKNMKGELFKKAIAPCGDVHIDLVGGLYSCIRQLENTAIRERQRLGVTTVVEDGVKRTPSGIVLP